MQDRVVIITGGGTGIGRAAALQFAQAGASIVVVGRRATPLEEVASVSDRIVPIVADIQHEPILGKLFTVRQNVGDVLMLWSIMPEHSLNVHLKILISSW